jgi:hypothetical protein
METAAREPVGTAAAELPTKALATRASEIRRSRPRPMDVEKSFSSPSSERELTPEM